jgi:hypothetical protein
MSINPKTIEEHLEYLYEIVKLKLFFLARWQNEHPEEEFAFTLRNRVDIFRKTNINPEGLNPVGQYFNLPRWQEIENHLHEIFLMVKGDEKCFEAWGFDYLKPTIESRCERDYFDQSKLAGYQCGFLRHNLKANDDGKTLGFHIANDCSPKSFFDDKSYIKKCFNELLDIAEHKFNLTNISCASWLNSVPKWLSIFPQEWQNNLSEPDYDIKWHYGFWGQFINARGCFNAKNAAILRETGKMPFARRASFCSIKSMKKHLNENY